MSSYSSKRKVNKLQWTPSLVDQVSIRTVFRLSREAPLGAKIEPRAVTQVLESRKYYLADPHLYPKERSVSLGRKVSLTNGCRALMAAIGKGIDHRDREEAIRRHEKETNQLSLSALRDLISRAGSETPYQFQAGLIFESVSDIVLWASVQYGYERDQARLDHDLLRLELYRELEAPMEDISHFAGRLGKALTVLFGRVLRADEEEDKSYYAMWKIPIQKVHPHFRGGTAYVKLYLKNDRFRLEIRMDKPQLSAPARVKEGGRYVDWAYPQLADTYADAVRNLELMARDMLDLMDGAMGKLVSQIEPKRGASRRSTQSQIIKAIRFALPYKGRTIAASNLAKIAARKDGFTPADLESVGMDANDARKLTSKDRGFVNAQTMASLGPDQPKQVVTSKRRKIVFYAIDHTLLEQRVAQGELPRVRKSRRAQDSLMLYLDYVRKGIGLPGDHSWVQPTVLAAPPDSLRARGQGSTEYLPWWEYYLASLMPQTTELPASGQPPVIAPCAS